MTKEVVNYSRGEAEPSQQINEAHKACLAAKELGGKKAHECGTWLLKQKEALPHGAWLPWLKKHCSFSKSAAYEYMAIAGLEISAAAELSHKDALWEVAGNKAFHTALHEQHEQAKKAYDAKPQEEKDRIEHQEELSQKAHECGTWLLKQKEAVPYGQWIKWVEKNCEFDKRTAQMYMGVAGIEAKRVSFLSLRDALWEVAGNKAFHTALSMTVHPVLGSYRK